MPRIFISYRRSEAEFAAGALGRELRKRFGDEQVFRDKEDIGGGVSWKKHVLDEIGAGSALLVLMGSQWASVTDAHGHRRLDKPDDPIRLEIVDAFKDGARVLPVLLEHADMPEQSDLPEEIRGITELNALRLRDGDWQHDIDRISTALQASGFLVLSEDSIRHARRLSPVALPAIVALSLAVAGVLGYTAFRSRSMPGATPKAESLMTAPARETTRRPRLDYGVWTLQGKIDESGQHVLDGSTVKFTSQADTTDGLRLEGTFTWRVDGDLLGEETFKGQYVDATRGIFLEGEAIKEAAHSGFPPGSLVLGSYSAVLSVDERELVDGRNGSTAGNQNVPLRWRGER